VYLMKDSTDVKELQSLLHVREMKTGCWHALVAQPVKGVSQERAYRVLYRAAYGSLPDRLVRTCADRECVNPAHRRAWPSGYCRAGLHDQSQPGNRYPSSQGCRPCNIERQRRGRAEWKARLQADPAAWWRERRSRPWRATHAATKAAKAAQAEAKIVSLDERRAG
jgi:hypothetical protein